MTVIPVSEMPPGALIPAESDKGGESGDSWAVPEGDKVVILAIPALLSLLRVIWHLLRTWDA